MLEHFNDLLVYQVKFAGELLFLSFLVPLKRYSNEERQMAMVIITGLRVAKLVPLEVYRRA